MKSAVGLYVVAGVEAAKGIVALAVAAGFLYLARSCAGPLDPVRIAACFHLAPGGRYFHALAHLYGWPAGRSVGTLASLAFGYSGMRLIEAYGLWRAQGWAKSYAVISIGAYIPFEAYELFHKPSWITALILPINLIVLIYVCYTLRRTLERR